MAYTGLVRGLNRACAGLEQVLYVACTGLACEPKSGLPDSCYPSAVMKHADGLTNCPLCIRFMCCVQRSHTLLEMYDLIMCVRLLAQNSSQVL
jgi:hypothetical protein